MPSSHGGTADEIESNNLVDLVDYYTRSSSKLQMASSFWRISTLVTGPGEPEHSYSASSYIYKGLVGLNEADKVAN